MFEKEKVRIKGLTLIEFMIGVATIGILAVTAIFHGGNTHGQTVHETEGKPASALSIFYATDASCGMR